MGRGKMSDGYKEDEQVFKHGDGYMPKSMKKPDSIGFERRNCCCMASPQGATNDNPRSIRGYWTGRRTAAAWLNVNGLVK